MSPPAYFAHLIPIIGRQYRCAAPHRAIARRARCLGLLTVMLIVRMLGDGVGERNVGIEAVLRVIGKVWITVVGAHLLASHDPVSVLVVVSRQTR